MRDYNGGMKFGFRSALMWHMDRYKTTTGDLVDSTGVSADVIKKLRAR